MSKISVIVPNYNHEKFLAQRLESVLNQTFQDFEVIILDDCSTDKSREVIESFRHHEKIKHVIYNTENSGSPFKQWKKGIELAQGKYIWIAESDDIAKPTLLEELMKIIVPQQNIVMAYVASTSSLDEFNTVQDTEEAPSISSGKNFIEQFMLTNPAVVNASAVVFRKDAVDKELLEEIQKYSYAGDWLFWCGVGLKGDIAQYGKILNFFRRHTNSVANKSDKNGLFINEGLKVIQYLNKQLKVNIPAHIIQVWASVWAQNYLIINNKNLKLFKNNIKTARAISAFLIPGFLIYYIKFRWFSKFNINH